MGDGNVNSNEALRRLQATADAIRADIGDPQAGSIISARNRQALDTTMQRFRADELTEAFVAHMVRRFGAGITAHHIAREMEKHK